MVNLRQSYMAEPGGGGSTPALTKQVRVGVVAPQLKGGGLTPADTPQHRARQLLLNELKIENWNT